MIAAGTCASILTLLMAASAGAATDSSEKVVCEGEYTGHLQGICIDEKDAIFWCFTTTLVKTDRAGKLLKKISVASHHGDLCFVDGKIYVAVNLGKFSDPQGKAADSWVYVYRAEDLVEVARHKVPELVYGAGGIGYDKQRFIVVGGLPVGAAENYAYEYDRDFKFRQRYVIRSGYTVSGIQTAAYAGGFWWFGCYGLSPELVKADESLQFVGKYSFDCALGIVGLPDGKLLIGRGRFLPSKTYTGHAIIAGADAAKGLKISQRPPVARP